MTRTFNFREALLPLPALLLPFYFLGTAFFLFDLPFDFLHLPVTADVPSLFAYPGIFQRFFLVITVAMLGVAVVRLWGMLQRSKVKVQNSRKFLLLFPVNALLVYWVSLHYYPLAERELILVLPFSLLMPFFFLDNRPLVSGIGYYFWLISALLFDFLKF